jgi:hypothetical protein
VLLLVAWADLTYAEVAQALSLPVGTVRSRLNRARRKVRAALPADVTDDPDNPDEPSRTHAPLPTPIDQEYRHE